MAASDFKMIRPLDAVSILTSTTIPETTIAEWLVGTAYGLAAQAGLTTGTKQDIYVSLQAANVGNNPTVSPLWWRFVSSVYATYNVTVSYALGDIVTVGHLLYESLVATNLGNPVTDVTKWLLLGATNAHAMFDESYGSQSTVSESMTMVFTPGVIVNSIALLNCSGATARVQQTGTGYDRTISLVSHAVNNWYDWYYETPINIDDVLFGDIPPSPSDTLTLTISNPGGNVACGVCAVGKSRTLGATVDGVSRTLNDYSSVTTDQFGTRTIVRRGYSERMIADIYVPDGYESEVSDLLTLYRATPMVFVGAEDVAMLILYGIIGAWSVPKSISGALAHIEIEGMI